MMTASVAAEAGDEDAAETEEAAAVSVEAAEVPGAGAASASLTGSPETPGPASSPRRRGAAAARATGATSRMMSRFVSDLDARDSQLLSSLENCALNFYHNADSTLSY